MKKLIILFGVMTMVFVGFAQDDSRIDLPNAPKYILPERYKMIGLNMTPLLTQLIPFNRSNPTVAGPYMMSFRSYRDNNAFRFGLGSNLSNETLNNRTATFNMRMGWEKKKSFYQNWSYSFGLDFFISGGGFNLSNAANTETGVFGTGIVWGIEYFLNPKISLNVETAFYLGAGGNDGPTILFIPPVGLTLNFLVPKRTRQKGKEVNEEDKLKWFSSVDRKKI